MESFSHREGVLLLEAVGGQLPLRHRQQPRQSTTVVSMAVEVGEPVDAADQLGRDFERVRLLEGPSAAAEYHD